MEDSADTVTYEISDYRKSIFMCVLLNRVSYITDPRTYSDRGDGEI